MVRTGLEYSLKNARSLKKKALYKCCDRVVDISNMGESALKSHMKVKGTKTTVELEVNS